MRAKMSAVTDLPPDPTLAPVEVTLGEPGTLPPEPQPVRQMLRTLGLGVLVVLAVLVVAMIIVIATLPPIVER